MFEMWNAWPTSCLPPSLPLSHPLSLPPSLPGSITHQLHKKRSCTPIFTLIKCPRCLSYLLSCCSRLQTPILTPIDCPLWSRLHIHEHSS